jgi:predicted phosphodiesterase
MRIQVLSDLHIEVHADRGDSFVRSLDPTGVDVLVLAGDIAAGEIIPEVLTRFCRRYENAKVLYVHGNHEFFGSNRDRVVQWTRTAEVENVNLTWLDNSLTEIDGQRFLGTPLWFSSNPETQRLKGNIGDFEHIRGYEAWVYEENAHALRFLNQELQEGDVVITHHLPHDRSIAPQFRGSPINVFFLCDQQDLITNRKPALWVHGHTHSSMNYHVGPTQIVCNPFGYVPNELNPAFDEHTKIDL